MRPAINRTDGWVLLCPFCGLNWKVSVTEVLDQIAACPSCLDDQLHVQRQSQTQTYARACHRACNASLPGDETNGSGFCTQRAAGKEE